MAFATVETQIRPNGGLIVFNLMLEERLGRKRCEDLNFKGFFVLLFDFRVQIFSILRFLSCLVAFLTSKCSEWRF